MILIERFNRVPRGLYLVCIIALCFIMISVVHRDESIYVANNRIECVVTDVINSTTIVKATKWDYSFLVYGKHQKGSTLLINTMSNEVMAGDLKTNILFFAPTFIFIGGMLLVFTIFLIIKLLNNNYRF